MKEPNTAPLTIPPDIAAKCDGPNQFEKFDRLFRAVISRPKPAVTPKPARTRKTLKK